MVLLSLKVNDKEINAYKWIISIQAVFEIISSILAGVLKFVSYNRFLLRMLKVDQNTLFSSCLDSNEISFGFALKVRGS